MGIGCVDFMVSGFACNAAITGCKASQVNSCGFRNSGCGSCGCGGCKNNATTVVVVLLVIMTEIVLFV